MSETTLFCQCCGQPWECCAPGTEPEPQRQGNLFLLTPDPGTPLQIWCLPCAPWTQKRTTVTNEDRTI